MKLIVCLDERRGMAFARRRQSKDAEVTSDVVREVGEGVLFVSPYSAKLFEGRGVRLEIAADPLAAARGCEGASVFLETTPAPKSADGIDTVIVYLWGRTYPADLVFETELSPLCRRDVTTFRGNSHDLITKETYVR